MPPDDCVARKRDAPGAGSGAGEPEYKPVPSDDRATDGAAADDAEAPKRQV